jgi:uncharacterized membrane protein YesL
MKFLGRLGDIIILNLIFVVTSLPVITIGTALSALYAVAMKLARGEDPSILKEYMKAFKRNMKPATIMMLVISIGMIVVTLFTSRTFVIGTIAWFFAGFAVMAYAQGFLLGRIFSKYE